MVILGPCVFGEFRGISLGDVSAIANLHMGSILEAFFRVYVYTKLVFVIQNVIILGPFWCLVQVSWGISNILATVEDAYNKLILV